MQKAGEQSSSKTLHFGLFVGCSIIYAALIAYGCWQDRTMTVKYTDVDYWILHDAAKLILEGHSPYDRSTFRYSPLLAIPLLPNHLQGMDFIGKLIFSLITILIGHALLVMLMEKQRMTKRKAVLVCLACWTLNPMVLGISTRGSSEAVVLLPLLFFAWFITLQRRWLAAVSLGVAVHLKLFPVIYLPSVLIFYGILPWAVSRTSSGRRVIDCATSVLSTPLKTNSNPGSNSVATTKTNNNYASLISRCVHLKRRHFTFTLLTLGMAGLLFMGTFYAYGEKGIRESLVYHLTRRDHRHNFSPFFTLFHTEQKPLLGSSDIFSRVLMFLPQVLMMLAVSVRFGKVDLPFACFLQTWLFVAFNRVITSQVRPFLCVINFPSCKYFVWFLFWLPLCINSLSIKAGEWVLITGAWLGAQGVWLRTAYRLEFQGEQVYEQLWVTSLVFLLLNTLLALFFIQRHKSSLHLLE